MPNPNLELQIRHYVSNCTVHWSLRNADWFRDNIRILLSEGPFLSPVVMRTD